MYYLMMSGRLALALAIYSLVPILVHSYDTSTLRLVQVLHRHGDRSPTGAYPSDPYQEEHWPQGFGQLSQIGMRQMFSLGQFIRSRYNGFINETYIRKEIKVRSTDKDRTLMSANSLLSGLYPPSGRQIWNKDISWQPIPVHTVPLADDWVIRVDNCPKLRKLDAEFRASDPYYKEIEDKNQDLIRYVSNHTGSKPTLKGVFKYGGTFYVEHVYNLTFPDWVYVNDTLDRLLSLYNDKSVFKYATPEMARLKGGPLLGHMLKLMKEKSTSTEPTDKMFLYSAHDTTINAFLKATNMFNGIKPPYASCLMVELHEPARGQYSVEFFYRNDTTKEPYRLQVPDCSTPCPLEKLDELMRDKIPDDVRTECLLDPPTPCDPDGSGYTGARGPDRTVLIVILVVLATLLAISVIALAVTCLRSRGSDDMENVSA